MVKLIFIISYFVTALSSISLAAYTLSNSRKNMAARFWAAICVFVSMWALFSAAGFSSNIYDIGIQLNRIANAAASYIPMCFVGFAYATFGINPLRKPAFLLSCIIPPLCTILMFHPVFIPSASLKFGLPNYSNAGPLFVAYNIHFVLFAFYGELILLKNILRRNLNPNQKSSAFLIFLGTSAGFLAGSVTFFGIYNVMINPYPSCFVWIFTLFGTAAIARYNLFGIQIGPKELPYFLIVALSTTFYLATTLIFSQFIASILNITEPILVMIAFLLCGLLLRPLQGLFENLASFMFFKSTAKQLRNMNQALMMQIEKERRLSETSILAAGMAHEIKNPLTALRTFAKFLPEKYDDPEFREKCSRIIQDEVDRINNIVLQLLDFSSPKDILPAECDLRKLSDETLSLIGYNLLTKRMNVKNQIPKNTIIDLDKNRFRQVLLNLLLNAIDASDTNGTITLTADQITRDGKRGLLIAVEDTGSGIPESDLQHIFDPFFSNNKKNGTGLGMSIVKRIVDDHSGEITVRSQTDVGTKFSIFIPHGLSAAAKKNRET